MYHFRKSISLFWIWWQQYFSEVVTGWCLPLRSMHSFFFLTTVQKHLGTEQLLDFWESNVFPFLFGRRWICLFVLRAVLCVQYQDGNYNQNLLKSKILQGGRVVSGSASGINSLPTQTCRFIHCGNKKAPKVPSAVHQGGSCVPYPSTHKINYELFLITDVWSLWTVPVFGWVNLF